MVSISLQPASEIIEVIKGHDTGCANDENGYFRRQILRQSCTGTHFLLKYLRKLNSTERFKTKLENVSVCQKIEYRCLYFSCYFNRTYVYSLPHFLFFSLSLFLPPHNLYTCFLFCIFFLLHLLVSHCISCFTCSPPHLLLLFLLFSDTQTSQKGSARTFCSLFPSLVLFFLGNPGRILKKINQRASDPGNFRRTTTSSSEP